jgi:hypothetical protein
MESEARQAGPVKLAGLPIESMEARRALTGALRGHALTPAWLPSDGVPGEALTAERVEHLRLLDGLQRAVDAYHEAEATFAAEDREHTEALRIRVRDGGDSPADDRTAQTDRDALLAALLERVEAAVVVLAEHVSHVVETVRQREDGVTGDLTAELAPAAAEREEAERIVETARKKEWALIVAARWWRQTADNVGFTNPPAPTGQEVPPPGWSGPVEADDLARHWSERKPWNALYEAPEDLATWGTSEEAADIGNDDEPNADETGTISELVETGERTSS